MQLKRLSKIRLHFNFTSLNKFMREFCYFSFMPRVRIKYIELLFKHKPSQGLYYLSEIFQIFRLNFRIYDMDVELFTSINCI